MYFEWRDTENQQYLLVSASDMLWMGGSVDHGSVDQWISERCMYVTPIRLDLLLNTNQISCYKGKMLCEKIWSRYSWERPYLFFCKRGGSIHKLGEDLVGRFDSL